MLDPHNLRMKNSPEEIHDGRPDEDHDAELSKVDSREKNETAESGNAEPHEKEGDMHEEVK